MRTADAKKENMTTTATSTPADVLARLQAAWHNAADVTTNSEAEAEPATIPYCGPHNDPSEWELKPDKYNRPGWHAAYCQRCGRFIGYQPPPQGGNLAKGTEQE